MPQRRATTAEEDEIAVGLKAGLVLEETEGTELPDGGVNRRRGVLRDRARSRGLKQISRSAVDEQGRVVQLVQWYREQPGDLRVREQPRRRRPTRRG